MREAALWLGKAYGDKKAGNGGKGFSSLSFLENPIMSNSISRDQQRRKLYKKLEVQRCFYKSLIGDVSLAARTRALYVHQLNKINRNSSLTRVRNRCLLTGRSRGVNNMFRISRVKWRELANQGLIVGVSKSSW